MVAEKFEGVASFDGCEPLRDKPLKFDRADFRAVLFGLRSGFFPMFAATASTSGVS